MACTSCEPLGSPGTPRRGAYNFVRIRRGRVLMANNWPQDRVLANGEAMYQRSVLDNGLRVLSSVLPHTRSVSISLFVGAGSRYEEDSVAGISHFVEHMLFKGTERRPNPRQLAEAIEGVGGNMNAATDKELTVYWAKVPVDHFVLALDVLLDQLLHSRIDPIELDRERKVVIEELAMVE